MRTPNRPVPTIRGRRLMAVVVAVSCLAMAAACGTRLEMDEIVAANRGGDAEPGQTIGDDGSAEAPVDQGGATSSDGTDPGASVEGGDGGIATTGAGAAGSAGPAPGGSGGRTCTKQGAPLVLANIGTNSGVVGANVGGGQIGAAVWAKAVNAKGGIACHPVKVITFDDGGDAARTQSLVLDAVNKNGAQAFIGSQISLALPAFIAGLKATNTPAIGGVQAQREWNTEPLLFPVGAGADPAAWAGMGYLAKQGKTKVAVAYCVEAAACSDFRNSVVTNAAKSGATIVYDTQVSLTQVDFTTQCQAAKAAGATQFVGVVEGSGLSRLARSCLAIGYQVPIAAISLATAFDQNDANLKKTGLIFSGPAWPWFLGGKPNQDAYLTAFKTFAGSSKNTSAAAVSWASGMMLERAIELVGDKAYDGPITTEMIFEGLYKIKDETLGGLVAPTTYVSGKPAPLVRCAYVAAFGADGFTAPLGDTPICLP